MKLVDPEELRALLMEHVDPKDIPPDYVDGLARQINSGKLIVCPVCDSWLTPPHVVPCDGCVMAVCLANSLLCKWQRAL